MKILVTGSEGNIGKRLIPYLKSKGYKVYRFDIKQQFGDDYTVGNICNASELSAVFERVKPDVVYHMAAMVSRITCEASPSLTALTNLSGTQNVIDLCVRHSSKLIYFSTSEVYGNIGGELAEDKDCQPNNFYGLTKYLGEKLVEYSVQNDNLQAVTLRPFMFYDENEDMGVHRSAMIRFAEGLLRKEKITVHMGAMRSWLHMDDAVRGLEKAIFLKGYHIINVGHPDVTNIEELAAMMCVMLNLKKEEHILTKVLPDKMTLTKYPNLDKQKKLLKLTPTVTIEQGVKRVLDVVKERIVINKSVGGGTVSSSEYWVSSSSSKGFGLG